MNIVNVKSEFSTLKKVVLTQSEFIYPRKTPYNNDESFLSDEVLELYEGKDIGGKNLKDVFPERQKQWEKER